MTVMAAEAAGGGEAAAGATAARSRAGGGPRPRRPVTRTAGGIAPAEPGTRGMLPPARAARLQGPSTIRPASSTSRPQDRAQTRQRSLSSRVPRERIHRGNYQGIILMEFVAAILLTAATPIATKKAEQGLSPYAGSDIVKLSAITVVYLILAMLSVGGQGIGRVAAWLGGLILLTDGLFEASNIAKDLEIFGGSGLAAGKAKTAVPPQVVPTPSGQPAPNITGSTGQG